MIADADGLVAPIMGALYQISHLDDAVHVAHLGVGMELHPLFAGGIDALCPKIRDRHDAPDTSDGKLMDEPVILRLSHKLYEHALFKSG